MFAEKLLSHKSISVVGLAKNAGKTTCLNFLLEELRSTGKQIALTSIGVDGESCDQVTRTPKPEIHLHEGTLFVTAEKFFPDKQLTAEILDISSRQTASGRLVTARAITPGKVILAGPSDTETLKKVIDRTRRLGADLTLVDGALSRLSPGSPAVTDALILATGAAVSGTIPGVVRKTRYVYDLICLEETDEATGKMLEGVENGLWAIDASGTVHDLEIPSAFLLESHKEQLFRHGSTLFAPGAVGDSLLELLRIRCRTEKVTLIIRDFTRMFAAPENYYTFVGQGGTVRVLHKSHLVAVCVNPVSPEGFRLDPEALQKALEENLHLPVIDVKRMDSSAGQLH